jgi:serine/threonine protein kinase
VEIAGRYEVIKKLGAGAFGTVYKAKDKILGRLLAIKTIRLEGLAAAGASLEELVQRFKQEAQVSAQLKHPNIVTIYDIGEADGMSYLAMEFIDGIGLEKVISEAGKLPLERAASLAAQVADALDFAHRNNVVHRDIKPANIMVETGDRVKVTDFGIAKVTNSGDHLTVTGSLLGTPSYMSPEQARGSEIDGRSDLFAVGAVFYEMLAGKKAFRGDSITGLIFKIITEEPQPIRELDPDIPDEVVKIIAKSLAKSPDGRYQTGREFADDLLSLTRAGSMPTMRQSELGTAPFRVGAGDPGPTLAPTLATPPTVAGATQPRISEPTRLSEPTRVSAKTGAHAPIVSPPPPRPTGKPPQKKGSNMGILLALGAVFLLFVVAAGAAGWYFFMRKKPVDTAQVEPTTLAGAEAPSAPPSLVPDTTLAAATPQTEAAAPTPPPTTLRAAVAPPPQTVPREVTQPPSSSAPPAPSFLDQEPQTDGTDAGQRLAQSYRAEPGRTGVTGGTASTFGTRNRFNKRPLSPPNQTMEERPVVAVIRHIINAEENFRRTQGHYGNFREMKARNVLFLDVPVQPEQFERKGYHFQLTIAADGFKVMAEPGNPSMGRGFRGDDSGYITPAGE